MRTRTAIHIKEGEVCYLRVSLGIKEVAEARGIDFMAALNEGRTISAFSQIIFCAALNDWEVAGIDNPLQGEFPYTFADFADWAFNNQREFADATKFVISALNGGGAPTEDADTQKKKRMTR